VTGREPSSEVRALAALLANLAERTGQIHALLAELAPGQLEGLLSDLERSDRPNTLVTSLVGLIDETDELEHLMAEVLDRPQCIKALLTDLTARSDRVDGLVANLERAIARTTSGS